MSQAPLDPAFVEHNFNMYDLDKNGYITFDELCQLYQKLGLHADRSTLEYLMKKYDKNGDGKINFIEFCDMIAVKPSQPTNPTTYSSPYPQNQYSNSSPQYYSQPRTFNNPQPTTPPFNQTNFGTVPQQNYSQGPQNFNQGSQTYTQGATNPFSSIGNYNQTGDDSNPFNSLGEVLIRQDQPTNIQNSGLSNEFNLNEFKRMQQSEHHFSPGTSQGPIPTQSYIGQTSGPRPEFFDEPNLGMSYGSLNSPGEQNSQPVNQQWGTSPSQFNQPPPMMNHVGPNPSIGMNQPIQPTQSQGWQPPKPGNPPHRLSHLEDKVLEAVTRTAPMPGDTAYPKQNTQDSSSRSPQINKNLAHSEILPSSTKGPDHAVKDKREKKDKKAESTVHHQGNQKTVSEDLLEG